MKKIQKIVNVNLDTGELFLLTKNNKDEYKFVRERESKYRNETVIYRFWNERQQKLF